MTQSPPSARRLRKQLPNYLFILPHLIFFAALVAVPVVFGFWISFHHWEIVSPEKTFVGLENYVWLFGDPVFRLAVFNTLFYTILATIGKFALGLWLALLLNNNLPFKSLLRALLLIPWIVPTVLFTSRSITGPSGQPIEVRVMITSMLPVSSMSSP